MKKICPKGDKTCCIVERLKATGCWIYDLMKNRECKLLDQASMTKKLTGLQDAEKIGEKRSYFRSKEGADPASVKAFTDAAQYYFNAVIREDGCDSIESVMEKKKQ